MELNSCFKMIVYALGILICMKLQCCSVAAKSMASLPKQGTMNSVTDFEDLVKCSTFVDKSMFIPSFFGFSGPRQFQLITCPRKFGKSTNLKMLKSFIEIDLNEKGEKIENVTASAIYGIFTDPALDLKVAPMLVPGGKLLQHFKAYAVINIGFKSLDGNYEHVLKGLRESIRVCYEGYEWLYKKLLQKLSHTDTTTYSTIQKQVKFMEKVFTGHMEEDDVVYSLYELSKILYDHVDSEIFLLLDDYDAPILSAIERSTDVAEINRLIERVTAKLLNPDHSYVKYAYITGTTNIFKSKFCNIKHFSFLENHHFAHYFGFTDDEVTTLLGSHGVDDEDKKKIKRYYKGYSIWNTQSRIYSPFSIVSCLSNKLPTNVRPPMLNYWVDCGTMPYFLQMHKKHQICEIVSKLLLSKRMTFKLRNTFRVEELEELQRLSNDNSHSIKVYQIDLILSYLFENGYLSYTTRKHIYTIPNREVEHYFSQTLFTFYSDICGMALAPLCESIGYVIENKDTTSRQQYKCELALENIFKKRNDVLEEGETRQYQYLSIIYVAAKQHNVENGDVAVVNLNDPKFGKGTFIAVEQDDKLKLLLELRYFGSELPIPVAMDNKARMNAVVREFNEMKWNIEQLQS